MAEEGTASKEAKAAAAAAQPSPAGAPPAAAPKFTLPSELSGKSAEEIGAYYSDRYKDYDTLRERAGKLDGYEKTKLSAEQIGNLNTWATNLLAGLTQGRSAVLKDNQIVFVDAQGNPTQAQPNQQDPFADWELVAPSEQAQRMSKYVWDSMLTPRIAEVVKKYDDEFRNAVGLMDRKFDSFMDALELWQANPDKIKIRDLIARANQLMTSNPSDALRAAAQDMLSPEQQKAEIQRQVAEGIAAFQADFEAKHQAPALGAPTAGSHRFSTERPKNLKEARQNFLQRAAGASTK